MTRNYCTNCEDYTSHAQALDHWKKPGLRCEECGHFNWERPEPARAPTLTMDPGRFRALKKAYQQAVKDGAESFQPAFCPAPLLTSYAKYLIEYLEPIFGQKETP